MKSPPPSEKCNRLQHDQVVFPVLFKTCPLTLRTKTFLLCKDVRRCLGHLQSREYNEKGHNSTTSPSAKRIGTEKS